MSFLNTQLCPPILEGLCANNTRKVIIDILVSFKSSKESLSSMLILNIHFCPPLLKCLWANNSLVLEFGIRVRGQWQHHACCILFIQNEGWVAQELVRWIQECDTWCVITIIRIWTASLSCTPPPPMLPLPMRHPPSPPFAFDTLTRMISLMLHFK